MGKRTFLTLPEVTTDQRRLSRNTEIDLLGCFRPIRTLSKAKDFLIIFLIHSNLPQCSVMTSGLQETNAEQEHTFIFYLDFSHLDALDCFTAGMQEFPRPPGGAVAQQTAAEAPW